MKVIMLHDCAYVGATLAKGLRRFGIDVEMMPLEGTVRSALNLRRSDCDLVHAHYARSPAWAAMLSGKKYIVHCHGDDIRHGYGFLTKLALKKASLILYSTHDLAGLVEDSVYLPNPIDTDIFYPRREVREVTKALYFTQDTALQKTRAGEEEHIRIIKDACFKAGIRLDILRRGSVAYEQMPDLLSSYDLFFDRWIIPSYSKTALEAMCLGIPVIGFETPLYRLLDAVEDAKSDPEALIERGFNLVKSHQLDIVTGKLLLLYQRIV